MGCREKASPSHGCFRMPVLLVRFTGSNKQKERGKRILADSTIIKQKAMRIPTPRREAVWRWALTKSLAFRNSVRNVTLSSIRKPTRCSATILCYFANAASRGRRKLIQYMSLFGATDLTKCKLVSSGKACLISSSTLCIMRVDQIY